MKKVVCFGEIMMRLSPFGFRRFSQADEFEATYAGAEANVAVSLANYGNHAVFVTKVPAHEIGQNAVNALRAMGVDTASILRGGPRLGIYFCEKGASQRGGKVIYDRAGSSFALAARDEFDWDTILSDADWLHFTGITPALGGALPAICLEAVQKAKSRGVTVSCDLNYRGNLWSRQQAGEIMAGLMAFVDVCIANEEDAKDVFGIQAGDTDINTGKLNRDGYAEVARQLRERFGCKTVAFTLRGSLSASDNRWSGMLYTDRQAVFASEYPIHIVDRVGGGDSFSGALIHALRKGLPPKESIEFAVAASCLKQTIENDFNRVTEQEVTALAGGNASGRVQR